MNRLTGAEPIQGVEDSNVLDFWQWAYSDIMNNAARGIFAEWLVAKALHAAHGVRTEWDKYDVLTPSGIKVEVKSSGYLQAWHQTKPSKIVFGIAPTFGWNKGTNTYDTICKRQADVYIFCVHTCMVREKANPLDLSQWNFYAMRTVAITACFGNQKSVSLSRLEQNGAIKCAYNALSETINALFNP